MSEANRTTNSNTSGAHTEDPLAELARIVSGDLIAEEPHNQTDDVVEASNNDLDLESELLRELDGNQPHKAANTDEDKLVQALANNPEPQSSTIQNKDVKSADTQEQSFEDQLLNELDLGQDPFDADATTEVIETISPDSAVNSVIDDQMQADLQAAEAAISDAKDTPDILATPSVAADQAIQNELPHEPVAETAEPVIPQEMQEVPQEVQDQAPIINEGINNELDDIFAQGFADELAVEDLSLEQPQQINVPQQAAQPEIPQVEDLGEVFAQSISDIEQNAQAEAPIGQSQFEVEQPKLAQGSVDQQFENAISEQSQFSPEPNLAPDIFAPNQFEQPLQPDQASASHQYDAPMDPSPIQQQNNMDAAMDAAFADPGSLAAEDMEHPVDNTPVSKSSGGGTKLAFGALGIALIAGLGIVGWGAMDNNATTSDENVPVVSAEQTPTKVKPQDPGGKKIANTENKVYENVAGNGKVETTQEKLINSRQDTAPLDANSAEEKNISRLQPGSDNSNKNSLGGVSPKRVRTLTIKPDGSIVRSAAPKNELAAAKPTKPITVVQTKPITPNKPSATTTTKTAKTAKTAVKAVTKRTNVSSTAKIAAQKPTASAPTSLTNTQTTTRTSSTNTSSTKTSSNGPTRIAGLPSASTANKVATKPAAITANIPAGTYTVQVSSQRSDAAAKASFATIKKRFSSVIGSRQAIIQKATVKGKGTFYRAKIPATSKAAANKLCASLKRAGGSCFVSR